MLFWTFSDCIGLTFDEETENIYLITVVYISLVYYSIWFKEPHGLALLNEVSLRNVVWKI